MNVALSEVGGACLDSRKAVANLQASFARLGREMNVLRQRDGRTLYEVRSHTSARVFSHLHDVQALLQQQTGGGK